MTLSSTFDFHAWSIFACLSRVVKVTLSQIIVFFKKDNKKSDAKLVDGIFKLVLVVYNIITFKCFQKRSIQKFSMRFFVPYFLDNNYDLRKSYFYGFESFSMDLTNIVC